MQQENQPCFLITKIILKDALNLNAVEQERLLSPYLNSCMSLNDVSSLVSDLTNAHIAKGFVTTRIKIPLGQELKNNILTLLILNGHIEDITLNDDTGRDRSQVAAAFPFLTGKPLNIRDLDQGLEQINRLGSNNATLEILPGEEEQGSRIQIKNEPVKRISATVSLDNLGTESTGDIRRTFALNGDNLAGINDNIYVSYVENNEKDRDERFSENFTLMASLPFGYWTLSGIYSPNEYKTTIRGLNQNFKSSGDGFSKTLELDRVIHRNSRGKLSLSGSITLKRSHNYIEDVKVDVSSRDLSIFKIGGEYTGIVFGGSFSSSLFYSKGLEAFGAKTDLPGLASSDPKAQFGMFEADFGWIRPLPLKHLNMYYSFALHGQYAQDTLFASEQISIGGFYSVRGFKEQSLSGDNGCYVRNDLSLGLGFLDPNQDMFNNLRIFGGVDYGLVDQKSSDSVFGEGSIWGVATGVGYTGDILSVELTYSKAMNTPDFLQKEKEAIFFIVSANTTNLLDMIFNN